MEIENKLAQMGLELPETPAPIANFVTAVRTGNLLFVAGHVPRMPDGSMLNSGKLGARGDRRPGIPIGSAGDAELPDEHQGPHG